MEFVNGIPVNGHQLVESVHSFNRFGQITPPSSLFNADRVGFYTGMQCEELGETIKAISEGCVSPEERMKMSIFADILKAWGHDFKQGKHYGAVLRADREELLDGGVDVAVVTVGSLAYQSPMFIDAIGVVLRANAHKGDGGFKHDANGKIIKPDGWVKPDLSPFVNHSGE